MPRLVVVLLIASVALTACHSGAARGVKSFGTSISKQVKKW